MTQKYQILKVNTADYNKFTKDIVDNSIKSKNLVAKTDFDTKLASLNNKINSNKTKDLIVENEFKKLPTFDLSYFRGKNYFGDDGTQNYLVFRTIDKYFKNIGNTDNIISWKSKGFPSKYGKSYAPELIYASPQAKVLFGGSCLKQDKITCTHGKIVNIYIVYKLSPNDFDFAL